MIHVIGNSHAMFYTDSHCHYTECDKKNKYFRSYSIGATIAYNFYEHHLPTVLDLLKDIKPSSDDYVALVVGEVDVRWWLPKMSNDKNLPLETIVKECVDRYFRAIEYLKGVHDKFLVIGAHPSTTRGHSDDSSEPIYGDCLVRNETGKIYNSYLSSKCEKFNIAYFDIFESLVLENGLTDMNYYKDYCHLSNKALPFVYKKLELLKIGNFEY